MTMAICIGKIDEKYETIRSNQTVFDITKKAVIVMACLHVLQNMSGASQLTEAETLKDKVGGAPVPLRDAIAALAAKHKMPAEPAAKRRKMKSGLGEGGK